MWDGSRSVRVWDLENARTLKTLADAHGHFVTTVAMNPLGSCMATGSVDTSIRVWECA